MSAAEFGQGMTIPAVPEQVRQARAFVAECWRSPMFTRTWPLLLSSELVTNSVRHSGSAVPGGVVTVTMAVTGEVVRVEVTDRCGDGVPALLSRRRPLTAGFAMHQDIGDSYASRLW